MNTKVSQSLKIIISHAYQEVEYYRSLFDEHGIDESGILTMHDFAKIPLLTFDEVQKSEGRFLAEKYQFFPWIEKLELRRSSSSSGYMTKVYWDCDDNDNSNKPLANFRNRWYEIPASSKVCSFFGTIYVGNKLSPDKDNFSSRNGKHLFLHQGGLTDDKIKDYLAKMSDFEVDWLHLRPSVALLLAETIKRHQLPIPKSLKYIELTGELLQDEHEALLKEVFQVELAYLYSSGEFNSIAFGCKHNNLHVLEDNVVVEIIKDGKAVIGEAGEICITSLTNHAMPLLRLMTGDIGILTETQCPCGAKTPILQLIESRPCEFVTTESGRKISNCVLESIVEQTNEFMARAIRKFRIIQRESGILDVELSLKPAYINWGDAIKKEFLANIEEPELSQAKWNFIFN